MVGCGGTTLSGRVVGASTGEGIPNALVEARLRDANRELRFIHRTDDNGYFRVDLDKGKKWCDLIFSTETAEPSVPAVHPRAQAVRVRCGENHR